MFRTPGLANSQKIPLFFILLVAFAVHGPLLLMQIPSNSYDANFHMSMAAHYAHHWFNPWNENSLAGFSQTTYPPLTQQWIGLLSHVFGLLRAYLLVQLAIVIMLPIAVFRFARLWVDELAAGYAALGSIFVGEFSLLVYEDGQIGTTSSTVLFLFAIPYFYAWLVEGKKRDLLKAMLIGLAASAAHHATTLFGSMFFVGPIAWLACIDYKRLNPGKSLGPVFARLIAICVMAIVGIVVVLLPYFLALMKNPINQLPIPHSSRANFLLEPIWGLHHQIIPMGALLLALPYIFIKGGKERRLRPLFVGFYLTWIIGLGGTTPLPRWLFGRAFDVLTFERFTFWAILMALPIVGVLCVSLISRFRKKAAVPLAIGALATMAIAVAWNLYFPLIGPQPDVTPVLNFLNRDDHAKYRYLTLGFGNVMSKVASHTNASSVDGEYNSARTLPEMTKYGSAQLTSSKYYGSAGIESLSAMLRHAPRYGLKYVFCHDSFYEPLLVFSGWRKIDSYNQGDITLWTTIGIPPAHEIPSDMMPPPWQGIWWGTLPFGVSIAAIVVLFMMPDTRKRQWEIDDLNKGTPVEEEPIETVVTVPTGTAGVPVRGRQRVLLISAFPPSRGDLNEYGFHLARALNANPEVELTVLADTMEKPAPELEGFNVQRGWKFNSLGNIFHVLSAVRRIKPDVVWFNIGLSTMANQPAAAFISNLIPALVRFSGYNTQITLHAFLENVDLSHAQVSFPALYRLGGTIATRFLLLANGVHVLLPSYKTALVKKYRVDPGRIHVHSHGVFAWEIHPPSSVAEARILAFGNWGTYKRLEQLLAAFPLVQQQVPDAELVIAGGDHPKAKGYIASAREQCKANTAIKILGYVPEAELPSVFRSAAVAVLPYDSGAGSSGVAHIAAEHGLPIVAANLPDFAEMAKWEGLAVEFYPRGDVEALAQAMVRVLASPELRAQMAAQNSAAAKKLTFDHVVAEYLESFHEAEKAPAHNVVEKAGYAVNTGPALTQNRIQEIQ